MPIYLPQTTQTSTDALTPRQIVAELDKYVIGQAAAKRAVAIALRNRMRRRKLTPERRRQHKVTLDTGDMEGHELEDERRHSAPAGQGRRRP